MKALVTGGAGFIGHHLVRALVARGDTVTILDDYSTGLRSRLTGLPGDVNVIEGDVRDARTLDRVAGGCEVIFHLAAITSVARSFREPRLTAEVNEGGTIEVMLAAGRSGARRVVLASSAAVYGLEPSVPTSETEEVRARSPYAASKAASESYLRILGATLGVETVVLRYFNVFGPGQDANSDYAAVIPRFIAAALDHQRPTIFGDGLQSRDFIYVGDVAAANLLAGSHPGIDGLVVNIGFGTSHTLQELVAVISECTGRPIDVDYYPTREGDPRRSQADVRKAITHLGFTASVPFRTGISLMVDSYRTSAGQK